MESSFIILIKKKSPVALLGGHYIYHIDETTSLKINNQPSKSEHKSDDARYEQIFGQIDIHKNFFFSYDYDITRSLQDNLTDNKKQPNHMFAWNYSLVKDMDGLDKCWKLPIIHGFVDQSSTYFPD